MIEIVDINDERINYYRSLKYTPKSHTDNNIFIAEGQKVVEKLLRSNLKVVSFFATKDFYDKYTFLIEKHKIPCEKQFVATKSLLKNIVGFNLHTGVMAIAEQPTLINTSELDNISIALANVTDAENVGAIVRNVVAFSFNSILFDSTSTSPYLRRSVRVSMGNIFDTKVCYVHKLKDALQELKLRGYSIVAAEVTKNSVSIDEHIFSKKSIIIFGNESNGISEEVLDVCDVIVHIPIKAGVNSINVAATSAIFLNHIRNSFI